MTTPLSTAAASFTDPLTSSAFADSYTAIPDMSTPRAGAGSAGNFQGRSITHQPLPLSPSIAVRIDSSSTSRASSALAGAKTQSTISEHGELIATDPGAFMNRVRCAGPPEQFLVSRLPRNQLKYWSTILLHKIQIGVSLDKLPPSIVLQISDLPLEIDDWRIRCTDHQVVKGQARCTKTTYTIENTSSRDLRNFTHFQFPWLNASIPEALEFHAFLKSYSELVEIQKATLTHLHCFGGHGRSGTFLLIRALMFQPEHTNVQDLLRELRSQRSKLVEQKNQYTFAISTASELTSRSFIHGRFEEVGSFYRGIKPLARASDIDDGPYPLPHRAEREIGHSLAGCLASQVQTQLTFNQRAIDMAARKITQQTCASTNAPGHFVSYVKRCGDQASTLPTRAEGTHFDSTGTDQENQSEIQTASAAPISGHRAYLSRTPPLDEAPVKPVPTPKQKQINSTTSSFKVPKASSSSSSRWRCSIL